MSSLQAPASTRPGRSSGRVPVWLPIVSGLVLLAGVVAVLIAFDVGGIRNTADVSRPVPSNEPATPVPAKQQAVPVNKAAAQVAIRFIDSAVARRNLEASYSLITPEVRGGLSLAEWKTGNIPVQYFPVWKKGAGFSPYRVEWSYRNELMLKILLVPEAGSGLKDTQFWIGVKKVGTPAVWKVNYFAPYWFPPRLTERD